MLIPSEDSLFIQLKKYNISNTNVRVCTIDLSIILNIIISYLYEFEFLFQNYIMHLEIYL